MLNKIIDNPDLQKYIISCESGQVIFTEGDDSRDLFILVSGKLDIIKGDKKISEITEPGELFGEMSVLTGGKRSATAKVKVNAQVARVPGDEIPDFLKRFPETAGDITKILAHRLDETNQVLHGLKEFSDQLPDAVIVTDREGKILTWNAEAEKIYGRSWDEMHGRTMEDIFEDSDECSAYLDEARSQDSTREKICRIRHPEKGLRYVSTSTTLLYDGHHNFQGMLSIGRDVTKFKDMEKRYRIIKKRLIPLFILLCLSGAGLFLGLTHFSTDSNSITDTRGEIFRNQLGKDFMFLKSLLEEPFKEKERFETGRILKEFAEIQDVNTLPYEGIIILNEDLSVFDHYRIKGGSSETIAGSSYSGIQFQGSDKSLHRVLTLYRADEKNPMGRKGIEIAFELNSNGVLSGWLVFQIDMNMLENNLKMNEEDLKRFRFKKVQN